MIDKAGARNVAKAVVIGLMLIPLFGLVIMWLWNWLMPELFGLAEIGLLQALGLFILSRALFGSFGSGHRDRGNRQQRRRQALSAAEREELARRVGLSDDADSSASGG